MISGAGEHRRGRADCEDRMEERDIGTQGKGGREKSHQEEVPEEGLWRWTVASRNLELCHSPCWLEVQDHEDEGMAMALRTERGKEAVRASRKTSYTHPDERTGGCKWRPQIQKPEKFLHWTITHLVYKN